MSGLAWERSGGDAGRAEDLDAVVGGERGDSASLTGWLRRVRGRMPSAEARVVVVRAGRNGAAPLSVYGRPLTPGGTYVMVGGTPRQWIKAVSLGPPCARGGKQFARVNAAPALSGPAAEWKMRTNLKDLAFLAELLQSQSGAVVPVIDRRYSLNEVPEAVRHMRVGHAGGKVVITI
ncbi:MAG: zinc-binding dehydrogenase [Solirubrobacteraceae bacterium]